VLFTSQTQTRGLLPPQAATRQPSTPRPLTNRRAPRPPVPVDPLHQAARRGWHGLLGRLVRRFLRPLRWPRRSSGCTRPSSLVVGPWKGLDVKYATLEWVDWFNHRRLLEPIGHIPSAEFAPTGEGRRHSIASHATNQPPVNPGGSVDKLASGRPDVAAGFTNWFTTAPIAHAVAPSGTGIQGLGPSCFH
jgi:hypothetical protein